MNITSSLSIQLLDNLGDITSGYCHVPKLIRSSPCFALHNVCLKWYDISRPEAVIPSSIQTLARTYLQDEAISQHLLIARALGFVMLHRCGEDFYFLIVCTWQNENELWETVYAKDGDKDLAFRPFRIEGSHRPTYCVWELGAVWHEQQAWSRYLVSPRDLASKAVYLRDSYDGLV